MRRDSAQPERLILGLDPSNFAKSLTENALPILIRIRDGIFAVGGVKAIDSTGWGSTPQGIGLGVDPPERQIDKR